MADDSQLARIPEDLPISNISPQGPGGPELSRPEILARLKKIAPLSLYSAAKKLGIAYTTLQQAVKEFEFCGLLKTKVVIKDGQRAVRVIYFLEEHHGSA